MPGGYGTALAGATKAKAMTEDGRGGIWPKGLAGKMLKREILYNVFKHMVKK